MWRSCLPACFLLTALISFIACKRSDIDQAANTPATKVSAYDITGFGSATNGGRLADIIAEFGDPIYSRTFNGTNYLDFAIDPAPNVPHGLVGLSLFEKNGIVSHVRPITGTVGLIGNKAQRAAAKEFMACDVVLKVGEAAFTIHPTSAAPSEMADGDGGPDLRMLRAVVDLSHDDAQALQRFTSTNIGKTALVFLETNRVSNFVITEELRTNTIELQFERTGLPLTNLYKRRSTP